MASIYEKAALTIAASDSVNSHSGCHRATPELAGEKSWEIFSPIFDDLETENNSSSSTARTPKNMNFDNHGPGLLELQQTPKSIRRIRVDFTGIIDRIVEIPPYVANANDNSSQIFVRRSLSHKQFSEHKIMDWKPFPLQNRAWAFQERLLSSRVLHYTSSELVWECKSRAACQCGGIERDKDLRLRTKDSYEDAPDGLPLKEHYENLLRNGREISILNGWNTIVSQYTNKELSFCEDRLTALSGLAKRFQGYGLGNFIAGMWEKEFPTQLLWIPWGDLHSNRITTYIAPTWSWASIQGPVYLGEIYEERLVSNIRILGTILELKCTPAGLDTTGAVRDFSFLKIDAKMSKATLTSELSKDIKNGHEIERYQYWITVDANQPLLFCPDSPSEVDVLDENMTVLCALWGFDDVHYSFLVLKRSTRQSDAYERLGLLRKNVLEEIDHWNFKGDQQILKII